MSDNVIKFPNKNPLFNSELRTKLETGVRPYTEKPEETVMTVEQIICAHLVMGARRLAERLGKKVGEAIMKKVSNE